MEPPETRYAKSGDVHIAYQVVGSGRLDLSSFRVLSPMSSCFGKSRVVPISFPASLLSPA